MIYSGIDLIEIERIESTILRYGRQFLERIYTSQELEEVGSHPASLAARFAAKEAVAKALGTGIGAVGWLEIEIRRDPSGQPILFLYGAAAELAATHGWSHWSVSLSHTHSHAIAMVVAVGD
ncbi:MAG TPA: holo-ACP synthase [Anaerolineales bacterium]